MSHEINLLPPVLRLKRTRRVYTGRIERLFLRVCLLLSVLVIIQAVALAVFSSLLREVEARAQAGDSSPLESVSREVMSTNTLLAAFRKHAEEHVPWTDRLEDAFSAMSEPVVITELGVGEDLTKLTISGTSDSRSAVATLRRELAELPWVAGVEVPLENFTVSNETTFTLHLTVQ
jgi:hypothetical protein